MSSSFLTGATSPKTDIYFVKKHNVLGVSVPKNSISTVPIMTGGNSISNPISITWSNNLPNKQIKKVKKITAVVKNIWELTLQIEWYLRENCKEDWHSAWSCEHMINTFYAENSSLNPNLWSKANDYWMCQLNKPSHPWFFKQPWYSDWKFQADYCISVWNNAFERWIHPAKRWTAYR